MPKIGTEQFKIDGAYIFAQMYYSRKDGFYIKDFPEEVIIIGRDDHHRTRGHDSEDSLRSTFREIIKNYHERTKSQRKVILYELSATAASRMNRKSLGYYSGTRDGIPKNFKIDSINGCMDASGFTVGFRVCLEVTQGETKYFDYEEDGSLKKFSSRKQPTEHLIDWSEEREAFFKSVAVGLDDLFLKVVKFLGRPDLDLVIDSAHFKLLNT